MKLIPLGGRGNEYLKRPKGKSVIWVDRSKKGFNRLQQSLKTDNPIEARKRRDEKFAEHFGEAPTLSSKVKQYNKELWPIWTKTKIRKSKGTNDSIKYAGQHLLPVIGNMRPDQLTEAWWENTYIPLKLTEKSDRKFFNEWKWLTSYLRFLWRQRIISSVPKFEMPDEDSEEGLNLSDAEIQSLYAEASDDLRIKIDLGFKHFMRRSEVNLLPKAEIDFKDGVIALGKKRTKIRRARQIPLNAETIARLKERCAEIEGPFVFPSPKDPMKSIGRDGHKTSWANAIRRANAKAKEVYEKHKSAGTGAAVLALRYDKPMWVIEAWIEKKGVAIRPEATFHDLRHSGLSRAVTKTTKYAQLCVMAGLSFRVLQKVYLHLKPDDTRFVADLVEIENRENDEDGE